MSQTLRKFSSRAPRYVLRPNDRHIVRMAPESAMGAIDVHQTRMLNISETGMALLCDASAAPHVNERISVEIPIPGGDQLAWWATVVRTALQDEKWWAPKEELNGEPKVIVALRFDELPKGHREAIRKGLESRFIEDLKERRHRQWLYFQQLWIRYTWQILIYAVCAIATFGLIWYLSRPDANYDANHGAPWGERYKWLNFNSEPNK